MVQLEAAVLEKKELQEQLQAEQAAALAAQRRADSDLAATAAQVIKFIFHIQVLISHNVLSHFIICAVQMREALVKKHEAEERAKEAISARNNLQDCHEEAMHQARRRHTHL